MTAGIVLDASALIAYLEKLDPHHQEIVPIADLHPIWVIHPLNLAEVLTGYRSKSSRAETMLGLDEAGMEVFRGGAEPDFILALSSVRVETRLKMPDVCAVTTALTLGLPLLTTDRRLQREWSSLSGRSPSLILSGGLSAD